jgi:chromosome partitioning protein
LCGQQKRVALIDADAQKTSSTWIENLDKGIPRPELYRIADPDPLLDRLPAIAEEHDETVVDGAGGLAEVQRTILLLAELILIPVQPNFADITASHEAIQAVRRARKVRGGAPNTYTVLMRVVPRTVLLREAEEVLSQYQDVPLLQTQIPQRQAVADSMGQGKTLFDSRGVRGATDVAHRYRRLFREAGYA